jgi:hypothetical protein
MKVEIYKGKVTGYYQLLIIGDDGKIIIVYITKDDVDDLVKKFGLEVKEY